MPKSLRICILGGCGLMGRVIVKCLRRFDRRIRVTVADRQKPAGKLPPGVSYTAADLRDHRRLVQLLRKHDLVVNSTSHHFNLPVMKAALEAGIHYLDLGGLFHYTRRQLKHHRAFEKKDVLAILGMGCAPGVANLLAAWAAEEMERVEEIHIKVGGRSWNPPTSDVPYAAGTIREELTNRPAVFTKGRWTFAKPQSGKEKFPFPAPVGRQKIFNTIHSEVATLPKSFPGVKECTFKIGFPDEMIDAVLHPRQKTRAKSKKLAISSAAEKPPLPRDAEITVALVIGRQKGKRIKRLAWYASRSEGEHAAGDWNTAWPPAIVSGMLLRGEISGAGVFPPEKIVPYGEVFKYLRKAGFRIGMK